MGPTMMVATSFLRVYQRAESFSDVERYVLLNRPEPREAVLVGTARRWLIASALPLGEANSAVGEGAYVRRVGDAVFLCPHRTRLRMLAGLLAFRDSVPEQVADAFVPEEEARRATHELATLSRIRPDIRSHIVHANWHVPLRWFAAFDGRQRVLVEDRDGLRIRYESDLGEARNRLAGALGVLETSGLDEHVAGAVRELLGWLEVFEGDGLLELDYGSVAGLFPPEALVEDDSAAQLQTCLNYLFVGEGPRAARVFEDLSRRWTAARALEAVN
jgi:hypothetical protein